MVGRRGITSFLKSRHALLRQSWHKCRLQSFPSGSETIGRAVGGGTQLFSPWVVIGSDRVRVVQEMGQVCASAIFHLPPMPPGFLGFFGALAQFLKGRSGPEVKRERQCTGRKTNRMQWGERTLHPHLGVAGRAAREPERSPMGDSTKSQGRLAPARHWHGCQSVLLWNG